MSSRDRSARGQPDSHYRRGPRGELIELTPLRCPNGHGLGAGRCLIGSEPCIRCTGHPHRTWTCRDCGATWIWPWCADRVELPVWGGR